MSPSYNLSLDMVYHPYLAETWHLYQNIIFLLSLITNTLTFYVILKKSTPEMAMYKYMLLNQLFWSFLFDLGMALWQPVVLLPFFMCYSTGLAQYLGPNSVYPMFILTFFAYSGMLQSIIVALVYRVSRLYNTFLWNEKKIWIRVAVVVFVVLQFLFLCKFLI